MAATQFFAVVELVEATLSHLDPRELLIDQRVNKTFLGVVQGSLKLQRVLFLAPDPERPLQVYGIKREEVDAASALAHEPYNRGENDQTGDADSAHYQTRELPERSLHAQKYTLDCSRARRGVPQLWKTWLCDSNGRFHQYEGIDQLNWNHRGEVGDLNRWRADTLWSFGWPPLWRIARRGLGDPPLRDAREAMNSFLGLLFDTRSEKDCKPLLRGGDAIAHPEASWRHMFLSAPPVSEVRYHATMLKADGSRASTDGWRTVNGLRVMSIDESEMQEANTVTIHGGVKLGDLVDHMLSFGEGCREIYVEILSKGTRL